MLAMVLTEPHGRLEAMQRDVPAPGPGQVRVEVGACAVCRTDLHVVDDDLPGIRHPIVPGHEIVGRVIDADHGPGWHSARGSAIPWLGHTCGVCEFCRSGHENLCDDARFTGYHLDGGFAEHVVADERFCLPLPAVSTTCTPRRCSVRD